MLILLYFCLRCSRLDGAAIEADAYARIVPTSTYAVEGLGEEERSVNLIGCSLSISSFKGRGVSDRFAEAIRAEVERFVTFLDSIDAASFGSFLAGGVTADLLAKFTIDEDTMDFELPNGLVSAVARLGIPISVIVDPE